MMDKMNREIKSGNKIKKPSKTERDIKKVDRTFEELSDFILGKDETNKNIEQYKPVTFTELQDSIIKKGGAEADRILKIRKQHEETMEELCDLCGKPHKEHDSRGFIYFHGDDKVKAGWSCAEEIIRKNKMKESNKI